MKREIKNSVAEIVPTKNLPVTAIKTIFVLKDNINSFLNNIWFPRTKRLHVYCANRENISICDDEHKIFIHISYKTKNYYACVKNNNWYFSFYIPTYSQKPLFKWWTLFSKIKNEHNLFIDIWLYDNSTQLIMSWVFEWGFINEMWGFIWYSKDGKLLMFTLPELFNKKNKIYIPLPKKYIITNTKNKYPILIKLYNKNTEWIWVFIEIKKWVSPLLYLEWMKKNWYKSFVLDWSTPMGVWIESINVLSNNISWVININEKGWLKQKVFDISLKKKKNIEVCLSSSFELNNNEIIYDSSNVYTSYDSKISVNQFYQEQWLADSHNWISGNFFSVKNNGILSLVQGLFIDILWNKIIYLDRWLVFAVDLKDTLGWGVLNSKSIPAISIFKSKEENVKKMNIFYAHKLEEKELFKEKFLWKLFNFNDLIVFIPNIQAEEDQFSDIYLKYFTFSKKETLCFVMNDSTLIPNIDKGLKELINQKHLEIFLSWVRAIIQINKTRVKLLNMNNPSKLISYKWDYSELLESISTGNTKVKLDISKIL